MRDYLEELLDGTGALLEELRRMERGLSNLTGGDRREAAEDSKETEDILGGESAVDDTEKPVYRKMNAVDYTDILPKKPAEQGDVHPDREDGNELELVRQPGRETETGAEQSRKAPLTAQLERLDRAVSASAGGTLRHGKREKWWDEVCRPAGLKTETGFVSGPDLPGEGRLGAERRFASSRGPDWVEQADRAFRRDSRRYDGGFYLY